MSVEETFHDHQTVLDASKSLIKPINDAVALMLTSFSSGGKLLACGNGGGAAAAEHFVAELLGRFESSRAPFPAISLSNNIPTLTAIANDFGYDDVFSRPLQVLARPPHDILLAISASGTSPSILRAVRQSRELRCRVIGLTGNSGGELASMADILLAVPSTRIARIQEIHALCLHAMIEAIELRLPLSRETQP